jgi:hypothetical protein
MLNSTGKYITTNLPAPTFENEWSVLGLARAGYGTSAWYQKYYDNLVKEVKEVIAEKGVLGTDNTVYSRVVLTLSALGVDANKKLGGYNLLSNLTALDTIKEQGINGPIFALLALDSRNYKSSIRNSLITYIVSQQDTAGYWASAWSVGGDVDITAQALQALAPYYAKKPAVKTAVDKAVAWLSGYQLADGGFGTNWGFGDPTTSECTDAQVVVALSTLGINPNTDKNFIKNGKSVLDSLASFYITGGGFEASFAPGAVDAIATEQCYYALVAYDRFLAKRAALYTMTDDTILTSLATLYVVKGTSITIPAVLYTGPLGNTKLTWKSSKKAAAPVTATGKVTAKKAGTYTITATSTNGGKLQVKLVVVNKAKALTGFTVSKVPTKLAVGKQAKIVVKLAPAKATNLKVTFSSSNKKVISVDKDGTLLAKKAGSAKITTTVNGRKIVKTVTVS